ncbi:MAG: hypothetical protein J0L66_11455 [Cytophagales bacterium]|nr:hypothetical protein [Cytophagales bacterium]
MKTQPHIYVLLILLLAATLLLAACKGGGEDEPTPADQVRNLLAASEWNLQSVQVDGVDKTATYSGLKIQFTGNSFTTVNGKAIWPASGTWSFTDDTATKIKRNDGLEMDIVNISTSNLQLQFTWNSSSLGAGRTTSVAGSHVLILGH